MMSGAGQAAPSASGSSNAANLSNPSSGQQLVQNAANPVDGTNSLIPAAGEIGVQASGNGGPLSSDVPTTAFAAPAQSLISSAAADAAGLASTAAVAPPASSAVQANQAAKDNLPIAQFAALQSDGVMAAVTPTLSAGAGLVASGALSSDRSSNSFLKSSEPKAGDSATNKSAPGSLAVVGITAVGRAGADGSAALAKAGVLDATLQTAQEIANNAVSSSPQHPSPSLADVHASGATAASTADVRNSAESGISGTSGSSSSVSLAAVEKTVGDKKSSGSVIPAAVSSIGSSTAAGASLVTLSAPSGPAAALPTPNSLATGRDLSATLTAPTQATVAVASQAAPNNAAGELPKAHQMLDSAPSAPAAPPSAPIASGPAAESQMNGQMHVGVRSDAFGTIDIHTVVQQSQVGITVHSDRDMAHWFSAEVAGLESGLNKSHLNLTGVSFDSGSSGVQSGSSFQHDGQPQQSFSQNNQPSSTLPGQPTATESAGKSIGPPDASTLETARPGSPAASGKIHVSIHA
jgi:trimeric autotransporter adhesin